MSATRTPNKVCAVVVDDSRDTAQSLARLLTAMGCDASFVTDPRDAVAEMLDKGPHIVFLDIRMPFLDGYEVAARMRVHYGSDQLKLVAVTGCGDRANEARSRRAGFDAHVVKPVDPKVLESILETVLHGDCATKGLRS